MHLEATRRFSELSALTHLREHGLRLHIAGEQLIVSPRSALTDDLRALIRSQKQGILKELAGGLDAERTARQTKVEGELRTHPELRMAFDVVGAALRADARKSVSVVLALRHGDHILSGELLIPGERWDMRLFLSTIDRGSDRAS